MEGCFHSIKIGIIGKSSKVSSQLVLPELFLQGPVVGAEGFQQGVELGPVVHFLQVAELVEHNIILQRLGEGDQAEIEVDVAPDGAAAPIADVVLDGDPVVRETVFIGQFLEPRG
jgi:hypothetical protein